MRSLLLVAVLVLVASMATAQSAGHPHVAVSGNVDVTDTGLFNWFSVLNEGPGDLVVHWYRNGALLTGRTQPVPAGSRYTTPVMRATMDGYRLAITGTTTATTSYAIAER